MKKYLVAAFLFMFGFAVAHIVIAQEEGNTTTN